MAPLAVFSGLIMPKMTVAQEAKPNIIFILADDLGYGELTCYNTDAPVKTPNIDRIAKTGVLMTQAYASPVSSPTRACFLTGKFPQKSGVYGNYEGANPGIGIQRKAFPEVMQQNGYRTSWFGKWHQGWDVSNHPLNNGFDIAYGFLGGMHDYWDVANGDHYIGGPFAPHAYVFDNFKPVPKMEYFTDEITNHAIAEIDKKSDKPFFMYLAYNAPHTPIQAPDKAILKYLKQNCDTIEAVRCAMLDVMDQNIGRILDNLQQKGLANNTLVVFMSDNGGDKEIYNGGLRGTKMTAWEGGVREPLIACLPGKIPAKSTSKSICSIVDMAATFINISADNKKSEFGDGIDLMPYWQGKKKGNVHEGLVFSIEIKGKVGELPSIENIQLLGVRLGDWKWVKDVKRNINALYNLDEDLAERKDLSESNPAKKAELIEYAKNYLAQCPPDCGRISAKETRTNGDQITRQAVINHLRTIKK